MESRNKSEVLLNEVAYCLLPSGDMGRDQAAEDSPGTGVSVLGNSTTEEGSAGCSASFSDNWRLEPIASL